MLQRHQHVLSRFARHQNVYFFEEPIFDAGKEPLLMYSTRAETLWKVVPHLNAGLTALQITNNLKNLLNKFLDNKSLDHWIFWYYSSAYLSFTENYQPKLIFYDYLEELRALKISTTEINLQEKKLLEKANVVTHDGTLQRGRKYNWDKAYRDIADIIKVQHAWIRQI